MSNCFPKFHIHFLFSCIAKLVIVFYLINSTSNIVSQHISYLRHLITIKDPSSIRGTQVTEITIVDHEMGYTHGWPTPAPGINSPFILFALIFEGNRDTFCGPVRIQT